jgi:hypothetical protein
VVSGGVAERAPRAFFSPLFFILNRELLLLEYYEQDKFAISF